ncbi:MAG: DUF4297 domain-containing protein [Anaerolineae bacterium]|nr:DUF4297 domain-containing protein [Anaerolineae bacterium]
MPADSRQLSLLETLFNKRSHGALTLERYQFQLLYSLYRAFELLIPNPEWSTLQFEGIEDVDLHASSGASEYVQVKSSANDQNWGWMTSEAILKKFLEVHRADRATHFRLVVDFDFTGGLQEFEEYLVYKPSQIPSQLRRNLEATARSCNCSTDEIFELCNHITIERTDSPTLVTRIKEAIIRAFEAYTANEELYFLVLMSRVYEFAKDRKQIGAHDLRAAKVEIDEWISFGDQNPAVQQGWIEKLVFKDEPHLDDYYEGKGARPAHIAGNLDAHRDQWIDQIQKQFQEHQVCVIRASSGQGKSTLLFRYAFDFYDHHTVLIIKDLRDSSRVEPMKRYIEALLKLNLPLLILINDLTDKTKSWHELVRELAGKPVSFLIATRQENWFRYSTSLENIDVSTVLPDLSFEEAQSIFEQFHGKNRIASNISSAAWAYEQVSDKKLLIEFVFLITQGQMLSERLEGQIRNIYLLQEDKAKLEILRLVSLAQVLDMRLSTNAIADNVVTDSDVQQLLLSMRDEYLAISPDGEVEGLHYVRSDHLATLLHDGYPISRTAQTLLGLATEDNLPELAYRIYASPKLESGYVELIASLVQRGSHNVRLTLAITQALFRADEHRYIVANQITMDEFLTEFDPATFSISFVIATAPVPKDDVFELLRSFEKFPETALSRMALFVEQMPERGVNERRFTSEFLGTALRQLSDVTLSDHLASTGAIGCIWVPYLNTSTDVADRFVESGAWHSVLFSHPVSECAPFLQLLYEKYPAVYEELWSEHEIDLVQHFVRSTNTLSLTQNGTEVRIEFVVDETVDSHQQALGRLELLRQWMPHFDTYSSQGLYPVSPIEQLGHDETRKSVPKERLADSTDELNKYYFREVRSYYATELIYDYLEFWHQCRQASLALVDLFIDRLERLITRKNTKGIQHEIISTWEWLRTSRDLPTRYETMFKTEHDRIRQWQATTRDFVYTYLKAQDARTGDEARLYRLNLFSTQHLVTEMQIAAERIRRAEGVFFDQTIDDTRERSAYRRLYETVECWIETSDNYAVSKGVKPCDFVKAFIRQRHQTFQRQLQVALEILGDYSHIICLPEAYLEEPPLYNLVIGTDVCATQSQDMDSALGAALVLLSELEPSYSLAYIIPLVDNRPVFGIAYRMARETVLTLVRGEQPPARTTVFPVALSEAMLDTNSSISRTPIPEAELHLAALNLIGQLHGLRNEYTFAVSRLNDSMADYLRDIRIGIADRSEQIPDSRRVLMEKASSVDADSAQEEWKQYWDYFSHAIGSLQTAVFEIDDYEASPPGDDPELSRLYHAYLVRRYCSEHMLTT